MAIFVTFDRSTLQATGHMDKEQLGEQVDALNTALEDNVPALEALVEKTEANNDAGACALVLPVSWRPGGNPGLDFFADGTSFRGMMLLWAPVDTPYVAQLARLTEEE